MKNVLIALFILLLLSAPFLTIRPIKDYYRRYEEIAKKYECYPVESCRADFNGDGKPDIFSRQGETSEKDRYSERLYIRVAVDDLQRQEILNIKYAHTDNTLRSHVAVFEENGRKKLVVYDTVNPQHFFYWDGAQLSPTTERTELELKIWKAMSLEDDTGGFNEKIFLNGILKLFFGIYYLVLSGGIGLFFYARKLKRNSRLI